MPYAAFVFLPDYTSVTLEQVAVLIRQFFESSDHPENRMVRVTVSNNVVTVSRDDWSLFIEHQTKPFMIENDKNIKQQLQDAFSSRNTTAHYACHLEVSANEDPDMDYFNDYLLILERLEQLPEAIVYDYGSGEIL